MKRFNYIIGLLTLLAIYGCKKDWEAPGVEPNHQVIYTSEYQFGNRVQVGGSMTFTDASKGIVNRTWTLPEGAVIEGTTETSSSADLIHIQFNESGMKEVQLNQNFAGAAYDGNTQRESVMDTTLMINVVDSLQLELRAHYYFPDGTVGEEIDLSTSTDIQAGRMIKYTLSHIGEPARIVYNFGGGDPEQVTYIESEINDGTATETIVQYKKLGTFSTAVLGDRPRPQGIDTLNFVNAINVIPSSDPLLLTDIYVKEGFIALDYSREIEPSSVNPATFSVHLTNEGKSIDINPAVLTAAVDPTAGNIVLIALDGESVYDDDVVTVSYQGGILQSTDFVVADEFTDELLVHRQNENILENVPFHESFEQSTDANWFYLWWGAPWDGYTLNVVDTEAYHGSKSGRLEVNSNQGAIFGHGADFDNPYNFPVEAGKSYEFGVWIKIESGSSNIDDTAGEVPSIMCFVNPGTDWGAERFNITTETPVGEWIYARMDYFTASADGEHHFWFRPNNPANPDNLVLYMDYISVREVNLRP
ncbi:hypothetical protein KMW28_22065 [Flammeovirga yaeyamensis]|uniref:Uncharacterized protein n=1 Tax=Flammeovirga yaeyamensis TaxID=367791 RepID=A0AAX1NCC3_9BACT|nr:hypothetical protein [Flammeovirga yaeyamensis]MBB3696957.1 hypothetical protein [Flammeovirga yaeyamensis]NMF33620.1 hypothetical protein [Flammeovirga yaeyamensis]QWG05112.1 hypothetical protein KMW28_22065 [Flammeovirga yaeyamensis]